MRLIAISPARVKAARKTPVAPHRFAAGLLAYHPPVAGDAFVPSDSDLAWAAAEFDAEALDRHLDATAAESAMVDRLSRGPVF